MAIFLVTFAVMLTVVAAMAVGVIANRKPIKGSCGGLNNVPGADCACSMEQKAACKIEHNPTGDQSDVESLAYRA